jgi:hypothetical protein
VTENFVIDRLHAPGACVVSGLVSGFFTRAEARVIRPFYRVVGEREPVHKTPATLRGGSQHGARNARWQGGWHAACVIACIAAREASRGEARRHNNLLKEVKTNESPEENMRNGSNGCGSGVCPGGICSSHAELYDRRGYRI